MLTLLVLSGCLIDREAYERRRAELLAEEEEETAPADDTACMPEPVWVDADGDGWGNSAYPDTRCGDLTGWATVDGDCDDGAAAVHPEADERCDTPEDDDCDGATNEPGAVDGVPRHADVDGDGFGDAAVTEAVCAAGDGWVDDATDCDDTDAGVNPGAEEVCNTGVDEDCDAETACRLEGEVEVGDAGLTLFGATRDDFAFPSYVGDLSGDGLDDIALADEIGLHVVSDPGDGEWDVADKELLTVAPDDVSTRYLHAVGGEFDGDGLRDFAVTAFAPSYVESAVFVFEGGATGSLTSDDAFAAWSDGTFIEGFSITTVDDMDGDGLQELAKTRIFSDATSCNVALYRPASDADVSELASIDDASGSFFGYALASGDIDGDRFPDLVIAAPGAGIGVVYVYYGPLRDSGLSSADADVAIRGAEADGFGTSVIFDPLLDANGDGEGDLVLGAREASTAYLFEGPLASSLALSEAHATYFGGEGSALGMAISTPDVDGDGFDDLLFGLTTSVDGVGALLFYGASAGSHTAADAGVRFLTDDTRGYSADSPGDIDGDGFDEISLAGPIVSTMPILRGSGI